MKRDIEIPMSSEITLPADKLTQSLLSAIFDQLSMPFETLSRVKLGAFITGSDDLEDLYYRVMQMTGQYQIRGRRCEFTVSVEEGGVFRFTSLEKLKAANLRAFAKQVCALGISWDLLILPPDNDSTEMTTPQRFKINVEIEDPRRARELSDDYFFLGVSLRQSEMPTATIRIDYSDYPVGRALLSVVEEWLDGLKTDSRGTISKGVRKYISTASSWAVGLIPIIVLVSAIIFEPARYQNIFTPIRYLLSVLLFAIIAIFVGVKIDEVSTKLLRILSPRTRFDLTSGDFKNSDSLGLLRERSFRNLWLLFVGILLACAVGVFGNYIFATIIS